MPPKSNSNPQKKSEEPFENKVEAPISSHSQTGKIKFRFLSMYRTFYCSTNVLGLYRARIKFLRKLGVLKSHNLDRYKVRIHKTTDWTDKAYMIDHIMKFKHMKKISFYSGPKNLNTGKRVIHQIPLMQNFYQIYKHCLRLDKIEFPYPLKVNDFQYLLKHLGRLRHVTIGVDLNDFGKEENYNKLESTLNQKKKTKKSGASKKGAKKKNTAKIEKVADLEELFGLEYNHFTNIKEFVIELKEGKSLLLHLLTLFENYDFPNLESFSAKTPEDGFSVKGLKSIQNKVLEFFSALEEMEVQLRESAKRFDTSKDIISVHGYESCLKKNIGVAANFGSMNTLSLKLAKTKEGELKNMLKMFTSLKQFSIELSPQADYQIIELDYILSLFTRLDDLQLYFKYYAFSQTAVDLFPKMVSYSPNLTRLWLGWDDCSNHMLSLSQVIDKLRELKKLSTFYLYLGALYNYETGQNANIERKIGVIRKIAQLSLMEFGLGAFFATADVDKVGEFFKDFLPTLRMVRLLTLKLAWHYNMWDGYYKGDFTYHFEKNLRLSYLKEFILDLENSSWEESKPKQKF